MPFWQSPPAVFPLHHMREFGSGGKGEFVQKLDLQTGLNE